LSQPSKEFRGAAKKEELVRSQKGRRSRASGSPELVDLTGFPLARE